MIGPHHAVVKMPKGTNLAEVVKLARSAGTNLTEAVKMRHRRGSDQRHRRDSESKASYQKQLREVIVSRHLAASPSTVSCTDTSLGIVV